jgi:hypothetical protein
MTTLRGILAVGALALALTTPISAGAQSTAPIIADDCIPVTLGHTFLKMIGDRINDGVMDAPYNSAPPGLMFRLDHSSAAPPEGAYIKFPTGWPIPGADSANRRSLPAMDFPDNAVVDEHEVKLWARIKLHNFQSDGIDIAYSCNPDPFGASAVLTNMGGSMAAEWAAKSAALRDGSLAVKLGMRADGTNNLTVSINGYLQLISVQQVCLPDIVVPTICTPELCTPRICVWGHCTKRYCTPIVCTPGFTIRGPCTPEISWSGTFQTPDYGININDFALYARLIPSVDAAV